jgi:ribonuclease-3
LQVRDYWKIRLFDRADFRIYAELVTPDKGRLGLADLNTLQKTLGIAFNDKSLLEQALVHRSYLNENPGIVFTSNERLEFLGDAILGLVVAEKLYQTFTHISEGEMTKLRATLVRRETLAHIAKVNNLGDYLYLGKGEDTSGGRNKPANLACALEAIIAAVFLDQGLPVARELILKLINIELQNVISQGTAVDYKSALQELIQSRLQRTPTYQVVETTGPDHSKTFIVEVRTGDIVLGKGSGKSKKEAQTDAARSAFEKLSKDC